MSVELKAGTLNAWVARSLRGAWAPIIVFVVHVLVARYLDVYDQFPSFDMPMHFIGGLAITHFWFHACTAAVEVGVLGAPNRTAVGLMAFLATSTSTILWEFAEWTFDRLMTKQMQAGLNDTMLDMFLGMLGAVVYLSLRRAVADGSSSSTSNGR